MPEKEQQKKVRVSRGDSPKRKKVGTYVVSIT